MDLTNNHVLITGGSDGIGKSLAAKFIASGSRVLITGRNKEKLRTAASEIPGLEILVNDIGNPREREALAQYVKSRFPDLNMVINNAGIQRRIGLAEDQAEWEEKQQEIAILFSGPVHLNHLLIPILLKHGKPSLILNVTSGGAYIPQTFAPVYSACKAALHSYTMTLRKALEKTNCRVVELVPPAVQTGLASGNTAHGVPLESFTDAVFQQIIEGNSLIIGYGPTENISLEVAGISQQELFERNSQRFPVKTY